MCIYTCIYIHIYTYIEIHRIIVAQNYDAGKWPNGFSSLKLC